MMSSPSVVRKEFNLLYYTLTVHIKLNGMISSFGGNFINDDLTSKIGLKLGVNLVQRAQYVNKVKYREGEGRGGDIFWH